MNYSKLWATLEFIYSVIHKNAYTHMRANKTQTTYTHSSQLIKNKNKQKKTKLKKNFYQGLQRLWLYSKKQETYLWTWSLEWLDEWMDKQVI